MTGRHGPAIGHRSSQLQSIQTPVYVAEKQCAAKNLHVAFQVLTVHCRPTSQAPKELPS